MEVSIVVTGDNSLKPLWHPLYFKYKDDPKYQIVFAKNVMNGINHCLFQNVFITTYDAIPTYRMMTDLLELKKNQTICPSWHEYMPNDFQGAECESSFSVNRDLYKGESKNDYIKKRNPEVIKKGKMYYLTGSDK